MSGSVLPWDLLILYIFCFGQSHRYGCEDLGPFVLGQVIERLSECLAGIFVPDGIVGFVNGLLNLYVEF